jgi:hypothetical protein
VTLVPLLRPVTAPAAAHRALVLDPERAPIRRPAGPFLHLLVAVEDNELLRYVGPARLREWGRSADAVFEEALAGVEPVGIGASAAPWLVDPVGKVFAVPGAREARWCDVADADALMAWAQKAYRAADDPISPVVYVREGVLAPFRPEAQRGAIARFTADVYAAQAQIVGDDLDEVLAGVEMVGDSTVARWVRGEQVLLPQVDRVALIDGSDARVVGFDALPGLVCTELDPPRYRTGAWPG